MSCDPLVTEGGNVVGYICRPTIEWVFYRDQPCPVCGYAVGLVGAYQEWYGTTMTCLACGDEWADGEILERPFMRGWRWKNVRRVLGHVDDARLIEGVIK